VTGLIFDTGVVLKLVVEEPLSPVVRKFVEIRQVAIPISRLVELEMENALQALCFRGRIHPVQLAAAKQLIRELFLAGRFRRIGLSLDKIAAETLALAPEITRATGCRTLDLMHVATAKLLDAVEFVSTDKRQLKAAAACGLKTLDLEDGKPL
jgi:predicted nucleic acid-binding protein